MQRLKYIQKKTIMKINKNECHHMPLRGYIIKYAKEYERGFIL